MRCVAFALHCRDGPEGTFCFKTCLFSLALVLCDCFTSPSLEECVVLVLSR